MNKLFASLETKFSVFALLFYSRTLDFESLFSGSGGGAGNFVAYNPLLPILSLIQHGTFLLTVFLLAARWKNTFQAVLKNKFLWALVAVVLVSFIWSDVADLTKRRSLAFLETTVFGVYLASRYSIYQQLRLAAWAIGISVILSILVTVALPGQAIETGIHAGAWRGVFIQKNIFARLLVLGSLVFFSIVPESRRQRNLLWLAFGLTVCLIFLASSISALLILFILLMLVALYKAFRWHSIVSIPLFLSVFLIAVGLAAWGLNYTDSIASAAGRDVTLSGRTVLWSALLDKIQERPWLGYGYMGFWRGEDGESAYIGKVFGKNYIPPHSHNGFLELILAFGLLGAVLFGLSFLSTARRALIAVRWTKTAEGLWPIMYLSFLVLYNLPESTLIEHNSIFWVLYTALASSSFVSLDQDAVAGDRDPLSVRPRRVENG